MEKSSRIPIKKILKITGYYINFIIIILLIISQFEIRKANKTQQQTINALTDSIQLNTKRIEYIQASSEFTLELFLKTCKVHLDLEFDYKDIRNLRNSWAKELKLPKEKSITYFYDTW